MAVQPPHTASRSEGPLISNPWLRWGLMLGVYLLLTLFFFSQKVVGRSTSDQPIAWAALFFDELIYWYLWALFTPLILWYARRYRLERATWRRGLLAHLALVALLGPLHDVLWRILVPWLVFGFPLQDVVQELGTQTNRILVGVFTAFYKYWLIIAIYYTFDYYHKYRQKEKATADLHLKTSQLEVQLSQARLSALKMQLHPHFLFNTLNTISLLMHEDVDKANRMLLRLSELLRVTLDDAGEQEIPLRQELAFLERYLEIEQIRFEDRLRVRLEVAADVLDAQVPNLILQPLVENAIRHGIARKATAGCLSIRGYRQDNRLVLEVHDDGPGLPASSPTPESNGIGLTNTAARLAQLYGEAQHLDLRNAQEGGTIVHLTLPFQTAPPGTPTRSL